MPAQQRALLLLVRSHVVHITVYRGRSPVPIARDTFKTWRELADEIEAMTRELPDADPDAPFEEQKLQMLAFGPHRLFDDDRRSDAELAGRRRHDGPYRHLSNVEHVTLMGIDVDRVLHLERLAEAVGALEVPALMYESPSSTPDAPRVRIVTPISRPIAVADCAAKRFAFAEVLGLGPGCGVEGAKDAARIYFAGRYHGTPERRVWRW